MSTFEHDLLICKCENVEHQIIFLHDPEDDEVYMEVHLVPEYNIWKRIKQAIKYIFGHRSRYGDFDCFIFKKEDAHKLLKIAKYLDSKVTE